MSRSRWSLEGRVAFVTGATRGIGYEIAKEYLEHGASVFLTARRQEELDAAGSSLSAYGRVVTMAASAGDADAIEASASACVEQLGSIDILVNNAATNPQYGPLIEADLASMHKVWTVNLVGPLLYARQAWQRSMRFRGGSIINVGSVSGIAPVAMSGAYNVGKAALLHLTRQLALELGPDVRVNALVPGLVRTKFGQVQMELGDEIVERHPLRRLGEPHDLAGAALLLASDAGGWMTGQSIVVDGGALQAWWPAAD